MREGEKHRATGAEAPQQLMACRMEDGKERVDAVSSLHDSVCDDAINRDRKYRREYKFEDREG